MILSTRKLGQKRKNIAVRPRCIRCQKCKYKRDFRKKNGQFSPLCRECRKNFPNAKLEIYGVKKKEATFENLRIGIYSIVKARYLKNKEVKNMVKASAEAENYADKVLKLPAKVAGILRKTFIFQGEDADISDDIALMQIRDLIDEIDEKLFRTKRKALVSDQTDESQN